MARIIKKYPNRRLYDTAIGTYITLEEIKKLVLDRIEFKIIDAKTEKDITQSMLLQIISEQEAGSTPIFTVAMLQDFIRAYHEKSQNLFSDYLEQTMNLFLKQKEFFENQWLFTKPENTEKKTKNNVKNKKKPDKSDH